MTSMLMRRLRAGLLAIAASTVTLLSMPLGSAHAVVAETSAERYGGADRYETAALIAEAYLEEIRDNPDRSRTRTAIVVSGEDRHAASAMPAAGLASAFDAPILLTPPGQLYPGISDFLETHDVEQVLVVLCRKIVNVIMQGFAISVESDAWRWEWSCRRGMRN